MNEVTLWNDIMLLKWDGTNPSHVSPEKVTPHWKYLNNFAKWNVKMKKFIIPLSYHNIKRLQKQFENNITFCFDANNTIKRAELFYDMCKRAEAIKTAPIESLPKYNYKVPPLAEYQHRGVVLLTEIPRLPLFADCGLGKSYMVLNAIQNHKDSGTIKESSTLICAKLATLESGWLADAEKFTNLKIVCLWLPPSKKRAEKLLELLNTPADAYLINHEGLLVLKGHLSAKRFQKVVVDESTILKGFHGEYRKIKGGQFGKALMEVSHSAHWRVAMTGTPAPNGAHDLWGQMHFLDPNGVLLEKNYFEFMHLYFNQKKFRTRGVGTELGREVSKWEPFHDTYKRINAVISPLMYRLRIRDNLNLPELIYKTNYVIMTPEQTKHYEELRTALATVIEDERIVTSIKLTQLMKLRQVTGGFIIDHKDVPHAIKDNPKVKELDSILEEEISTTEKVIIYAQYRYEIEMLEARYKHYGSVSVYGDNDTKENLDNIKRFINDPSIRIIVLHPKSAAHGITFVVAHYMVFYSGSYSEEEHYQCVKRIERAGQKSTMVVIYLQCKDTIDTVMHDVLRAKSKDQTKLIDTDQLLLQKWRTHDGSTGKN